MIGRRVDSIDALEQAGDYFGPTTEVDRDGNPTGVRGLWFLLPIHEGGVYERRTPGSGLRRISEPPWTFRECSDGSVEVRASIYCSPGEPGEWHGYLDEGHVWRAC